MKTGRDWGYVSISGHVVAFVAFKSGMYMT